MTRVFQALLNALERGIEIQFFLETDDEKVTGGGAVALRTLPPAIRLFTWSDEQRLRNKRGVYGTLHAKLAVADEDQLLVSSANFTENALSMNIELGLLVSGGPLPLRAHALLENLIRQGIFVEA